jgi:hypothetical protein
LKKFSDPVQYKVADSVVIEAYEGKLPNILLECWREFGFCNFKNGLFSIIDPFQYREAASTWLKGTSLPQIDNFHAFARSGFGELFLWGENTGQHFSIEVATSSIFDNGSNENYINKEGANEAILNFFTVLKPSSLDLEDIYTNQSIFEDAVDKFGPLEADEMFTFEPALFLGGEQTIKTVNKVNFFIQSEILASMGQREIMDIKGLAKKAFGK